LPYCYVRFLLKRGCFFQNRKELTQFEKSKLIKSTFPKLLLVFPFGKQKQSTPPLPLTRGISFPFVGLFLKKNEPKGVFLRKKKKSNGNNFAKGKKKILVRG
jgi:hypothetical protein